MIESILAVAKRAVFLLRVARTREFPAYVELCCPVQPAQLWRPRLRNSSHLDGNIRAPPRSNRKAKVAITIAPLFFSSSPHFRFVPAATYDHVNGWKNVGLAVVNFLGRGGKNGRFDRPVLIRLDAFDLVAIFTYTRYDLFASCSIPWVKDVFDRVPSIEKFITRVWRAGTNDSCVIIGSPRLDRGKAKRYTVSLFIDAKTSIHLRIFSYARIFSFFHHYWQLTTLVVCNSDGNFPSLWKYSKIIPSLLFYSLFYARINFTRDYRTHFITLRLLWFTSII